MNFPYFLDDNLARGIFGFILLTTLMLLIWQKDKSVFGFLGIIFSTTLFGFLVIKTNFLVSILFFAIAGFCIAWMGRDELVKGRKWFVALFIVSVVIGVFYLFIGERALGESLFMMSIVSLASLATSYYKRVTGHPLPEE